MNSVNTRLKARIVNHAIIIAGSAAALWAAVMLIDSEDLKFRWSMATGYVSIILLGLSLVIGPYNVYTKRLNPMSSDIRRDVGIWCGVIGLAHVIIGIQVHMGNIWLYFFKRVEGEGAFKLRADLFGAANYFGLAATVILLILLLLSNDLSLKLLKPSRWKMFQRWNYILFLTVLIHAVMYQSIENRMLPVVTVFCIIMIIPVIGQVVGFTKKILEK